MTRPALSEMADLVVAWFERFELNELKNEKQTPLVDDVLIEITRRADRARRREEWNCALRDGQLALDRVAEWPIRINKNGAADQKVAIYSEAVARLYAGALGLALRDARAASGHFRLTARMFGDLGRRRAESIAQAATGMAHAISSNWADALEAYQQSIALIDRISPLSSPLKELRRQIVQTVSMTLDYYEQEASPGNTR